MLWGKEKMSLKHAYRSFLKKCENIPGKIVVIKTKLFEEYDIARKKALFENISWTHEQTETFDQYWTSVYHKKISPRWHKLYQAVSGKYNIKYLGEKIWKSHLVVKMMLKHLNQL